MVKARIILFVIAAVCFFEFFTYDSYKWAREEKTLTVSAKASSIQNGKLQGAFLIYREVKGFDVVGEPRTVLVDQNVYDSTQIGDVKVEFERGRVTYIIFFAGIVALFFLFLSIDPNMVDLIGDLIDF